NREPGLPAHSPTNSTPTAGHQPTANTSRSECGPAIRRSGRDRPEPLLRYMPGVTTVLQAPALETARTKTAGTGISPFLQAVRSPNNGRLRLSKTDSTTCIFTGPTASSGNTRAEPAALRSQLPAVMSGDVRGARRSAATWNSK